MTDFDPSAYGPLVAELLPPERLLPLGPGTPDPAAKPKLQALTIEALFPQGTHDADMARCCIAALWLWHDFLDEAHKIVQHVGSLSASYWHGIIHRREKDYSNAKYWFRHVGPHPVTELLQLQASGILRGFTSHQIRPPGLDQDWQRGLMLDECWDPVAFVDLCESDTTRDPVVEEFARVIQRLEWQLLFDWCWQNATR
ncbi:MAG TPA: hypothetical protein VGZ47_20480 [Gemmataceae bacterium]|jgi:hypothetical protein|nr:hypothetical protein [Gemmataceae bacterium]